MQLQSLLFRLEATEIGSRLISTELVNLLATLGSGLVSVGITVVAVGRGLMIGGTHLVAAVSSAGAVGQSIWS